MLVARHLSKGRGTGGVVVVNSCGCEKENGRTVERSARRAIRNLWLPDSLLRFVRRVEGVLQSHKVFARFQGVEQDLFGLELFG